MATYRHDNVWCWAEQLTDLEARRLDRLFSAEIKGIRHNRKLKQLLYRGIIDGKTHFLKHIRSGLHQFPAGLLPLSLASVPGTVNDLRQPATHLRPITTSSLHGITLTDWQFAAAQSCLKLERGVLKMATNAGKTEVAAAVLKALPDRALYLVHQKDLLYQTHDRLAARLKEPIGVIGDGVHNEQRVTVAMVQSIEWRKKFDLALLNKHQALIMDEAHHAGSNTWFAIAMRCRAARYRIAMSGTPFHADDPERNLRLMGATGSALLYEIRNRQLIDSGWSAEPVIHLAPYQSAENALPYDLAYKRHLSDPQYNQSIVRRVATYAEEGHACLVLTNRRAHGMLLRDMFSGADIPAKFVSGSDLSSWRKAKLDQLRSRKLAVLIATTIFDEGVDAPAISCLALASAGKSQRQILQRIGRALRKKEGDNVAHVLDWEPRTNYYLLKHALERQAIYKEEGFRVLRERA